MSEKTIIHKRAAWRRIGRGIPGVPSETDPTVDLRNVLRPGQPKARGPNTARWVCCTPVQETLVQVVVKKTDVTPSVSRITTNQL